jgi:hypothetical protein
MTSLGKLVVRQARTTAAIGSSSFSAGMMTEMRGFTCCRHDSPAQFAVSNSFKRACHSSSSTTSNRIVLFAIAGTSSLHSRFFARSVQMLKTERL